MVELITEKFRHHSLQDSHPEQESVFMRPNPCTRARDETSAFKVASTSKKAWDVATEGCNAFSAFRQTKTPQRSLETPTFGGIYRKKVPCHQCESAPNTPPVPPKKRHCRSLSIPNGSTWSHCRCHHYPSNVWKPVALRPHLNNNKLMKNRNSPLACLRGSNTSPGHYYGGGTSPGTGLRSSSEFSSPPDSPVPRPASVSSGYYDSSMSSLGAPWLDQTSPQHYRFNVFQNRSLSMEETISTNQSNVAGIMAGSMPSMTGSMSSVPSSPRRHRIPRCRSQPCVLHERRGGLKRRREEDQRPTVDFIKMKETAYDFDRFLRPKSSNMSQPQDIRSPSRNLASMFCEQEQVFGLKPITGSPLDSSIPGTVVVSPATSPTKEVCEEMDSKLSDSGCSDTGDPPEILSFSSDVDDSCVCHDIRQEEVFHIDVGNELDLDLIEND